MVRALPFRTPTQLDFGRVLAIAAAIALHVLVLLLLLMPMAAPPLAPRVVKDFKPDLIWYPKPTPVIEEMVITKPQPERSLPKPSVPVTPTRPVVPTETQVIVEGGSEPAVAPAAESFVDTIGPAVVSGPIAASHLEYVAASAPRYPPDLIRAGVSGTVLLRVLVDVDGVPLEVSIERSSGNKRLDREASQHVLKKWRFKPAIRDGVATQAYGIVPIDFTLQ